ncbi:copper transporter [Terrisporobacter sp.]
MNINMKYYIVTICAIFIALGVGILVGFNLNYDEALAKQQSEVLESFNTEFDDLKSKNKKLQSEIENSNGNLDTLKSYVDKNLNVLTANELTDKNIGIILTSENHDYSEQLENLIKNANGTVSFNIVIKDNIGEKDKLSQLSKDLNKQFKSSKDVIDYIVDALESPKGYDELYSLQDLDIIKINEIDQKKYQDYDSVVLLGELNGDNIKTKFNEKEKLVLGKLKEEDKYLVAVSPSDSDDTVLKLYMQNNISTIDNINEGIGKVSLVNLLKNQNIVGSYGINAKELIAYDKN